MVLAGPEADRRAAGQEGHRNNLHRQHNAIRSCNGTNFPGHAAGPSRAEMDNGAARTNLHSRLDSAGRRRQHDDVLHRPIRDRLLRWSILRRRSYLRRRIGRQGNPRDAGRVFPAATRYWDNGQLQPFPR